MTMSPGGVLCVAPSTFLSPRALFVAPRRKPRGPSALACLGKTRWEAVVPRRKPRGLLLGTLFRPLDAVPNAVRDARLTLGRTE
jgi:hypothetical protein